MKTKGHPKGRLRRDSLIEIDEMGIIRPRLGSLRKKTKKRKRVREK